MHTDERHKGFGFVTFASSADAQDAIDNMDLNELRGKVLRVNLARPSKIPVQGLGNKASTSLLSTAISTSCLTRSAVWESEEWLKQHAKPLARSGGAFARASWPREPHSRLALLSQVLRCVLRTPAQTVQTPQKMPTPRTTTPWKSKPG